MESDLSHEELVGLLGAFALDAVDPSEAAAVRAHLLLCPRCRDEVAQHQQTAAMLASTGSEAPTDLWAGIASRLEAPNTTEQAFPRLDRAGRTARSTSRRRKYQFGLRTGALIGAAAAAAFAVLGVEVGRLDHRVNQVEAASGGQSLSAAARSALLDPTASRVILKETDSGAQPAAEVVALRSGAAYLFNDRLPDLPSAETYQLWAMIDGQPISVGLLGTHPSTVAFTLDPTDLTNAFAVTVEPAGGSLAPTHPPVARTTG
jgi:anti-sigma-K factor RskA